MAERGESDKRYVLEKDVTLGNWDFLPLGFGTIDGRMQRQCQNPQLLPHRSKVEATRLKVHRDGRPLLAQALLPHSPPQCNEMDQQEVPPSRLRPTTAWRRKKRWEKVMDDDRPRSPRVKKHYVDSPNI